MDFKVTEKTIEIHGYKVTCRWTEERHASFGHRMGSGWLLTRVPLDKHSGKTNDTLIYCEIGEYMWVPNGRVGSTNESDLIPEKRLEETLRTYW